MIPLSYTFESFLCLVICFHGLLILQVCLCMCVCVCMLMCVCLCVGLCVCSCMLTYVSVCICPCSCAFVSSLISGTGGGALGWQGLCFFQY